MHEYNRRASDRATRVDKIANNNALTVYARVASAIVSTFAIPFLVWMVTTIYQYQTQLAVLTSDGLHLQAQVTEILGDRYRVSDAMRDNAVQDHRMDKIESDVKDLNTRIDLLQTRR